ncbi:GntR family transcriptional regulator [Roseomonas xinghualingensis]|uniref:GntR family transcriptional regulator n=1 Tax=Roseomonas xinghualingensis TaxID=2986475 RepID=UPI0021F19261|nr:GntR family transcriptional regulator [Roseomonas sp. SXEYE001]MCV4210338.1 GntR family transcriptional regulator [Roseomonas sp. SXEYE001]
METASLREQALVTIKQGILDSRYPPGSLISENQLAEELRISRTPVREAIRELAASGLVRILPQRGIIVSEPSMQDVVEVYQLREQLECFAIRIAAGRLSPADAELLRADHGAALKHMKAGRLQDAYDASVLMHARIITLAQNGRLVKFMNQLSDQVHRFGMLTLRHGRVEPALHEHGQIIDALIRQDADAAEALMRQHLRADRDMALRLILPAGISAGELTA